MTPMQRKEKQIKAISDPKIFINNIASNSESLKRDTHI